MLSDADRLRLRLQIVAANVMAGLVRLTTVLCHAGARTFDSSYLTPYEHGTSQHVGSSSGDGYHKSWYHEWVWQPEPDVFICHPNIDTPIKSSMLRSCQLILYSRTTKLCFLSSGPASGYRISMIEMWPVASWHILFEHLDHISNHRDL